MYILVLRTVDQLQIKYQKWHEWNKKKKKKYAYLSYSIKSLCINAALYQPKKEKKKKEITFAFRSYIASYIGVLVCRPAVHT